MCLVAWTSLLAEMTTLLLSLGHPLSCASGSMLLAFTTMSAFRTFRSLQITMVPRRNLWTSEGMWNHLVIPMLPLVVLHAFI